MPGKYLISDVNRSFRFLLISSNGDQMMHSQDYPNESACLSAIEQLKICVTRAHCFKKLTQPDGRFYFIVREEDDNIIATGEPYWTDSSRDYAIMIVKREGASAVIK